MRIDQHVASEPLGSLYDAEPAPVDDDAACDGDLPDRVTHGHHGDHCRRPGPYGLNHAPYDLGRYERARGVVDRSGLRAVQTPQGFARDVLVSAHAAAAGSDYTDDAAVCEASGYEVVLVPGSREALKITEPYDLAVAEAIVAGRR